MLQGPKYYPLPALIVPYDRADEHNAQTTWPESLFKNFKQQLGRKITGFFFVNTVLVRILV